MRDDVRGYTRRNGVPVRSYARNRWGPWQGDEPARPAPASDAAPITPTERLHELLRRLALASSRAARCASPENINTVIAIVHRLNARVLIDAAPKRQSGPSLGRTDRSI